MAPTPPIGTRQRVLFSVGPDEATAPMRSARADGGDDRARPSARRLSRTQVSEKLDLAVRSKVLKQSGGFYGGGGCTVAGCPGPAYSSEIEQGIEVERLSTGHRRQLTRGGSDVAPALSPDGTFIAYSSHVVRKDVGQQDVVALVTPSGRDLGPLALPPRDQTDGAPVWAPNGRAVATVRVRIEGGQRISTIMLLPIDGRPARRLSEGAYEALTWSPDGHTIATTAGGDIVLVDVDSGRARRLTRFARPDRTFMGSYCGAGGGYQVGVYGPSFSPDSRYVAFVSSYPHEAELGYHSDVMSVDVRTGRVRTVHRTPKVPCPFTRFLRTSVYGWVV